MKRGADAAAKGAPARAIADFTAVLQTKPSAAVAALAYAERSSAYVDKEDKEHALNDANECIRLDPRIARAYQSRGRVYCREGRIDDAIAEYNKGLSLNPDFAYLYVNRAVAYETKGDHSRAISDCNEAIRREPKLTDAYVDRGIAYYSLGQNDKALADYNKGIDLSPTGGTTGNSYFNRGLLYHKTHKLDAAIRDFSRVIRQDPKSADAYRALGRAYADKGDYKRAVAELQTALKLAPTDTRALNSLSWLRATCPDESMRSGKDAVRIGLELCRLTNWKNAADLDTLAAAYAEIGDFDKAVEYQRQVLQKVQRQDSEREGTEARLKLYQEHKPFRDNPNIGRIP